MSCADDEDVREPEVQTTLGADDRSTSGGRIRWPATTTSPDSDVSLKSKDNSPLRPLPRALLVGAVAMVAVSIAAAVSNSIPLLHPIAHTVQLWTLAIVVGARRSSIQTGAITGALTLILGVVTFYVSSAFVVAIKYGGWPYIHTDAIAVWATMGAVGGAALGVAASRISATPKLGYHCSAFFIALQFADAALRYKDYREWLPIFLAFAASVVIVWLSPRKRRLMALVLAIPYAAIALGILVATNALGLLS